MTRARPRRPRSAVGVGLASGGKVRPTKTEQMRSVRLEPPLADDLKAHRVASGNPPDKASILPRADGSAWTDTDYRNLA